MKHLKYLLYGTWLVVTRGGAIAAIVGMIMCLLTAGLASLGLEPREGFEDSFYFMTIVGATLWVIAGLVGCYVIGRKTLRNSWKA